MQRLLLMLLMLLLLLYMFDCLSHTVFATQHFIRCNVIIGGGYDLESLADMSSLRDIQNWHS